MSENNEVYIINLINRISYELNRYITLFVFIFGTLGNLINIFVLCQPRLRRNASIIYFIGSSVAGVGIMLIGLPSRIIAGWISTDPTNTNSALCKSRIFFLYSFRTASVWLIVLATIDRWLSSSSGVSRRRLSSVKIALKAMFIAYIISFIVWFESIFCYGTDVAEAPVRCYGKNQACRIFNDITYAIATVIVPSILMLVFGLLTIRQLIQSRRQVAPTLPAVIRLPNENQPRRRTTKARQASLTRMLIFQVILLTLFSLPQALHQIFLTLTIQTIRSPLRQSIESFIVNLNFSLTYVGNGTPFYIYTLTAPIFRRTLFELIILPIKKIMP